MTLLHNAVVFMVDSAFKSALLIIVAAVVVLFLKRDSVRHFVWFCAFAGCLWIPISAAVFPPINTRLPISLRNSSRAAALSEKGAVGSPGLAIHKARNDGTALRWADVFQGSVTAPHPQHLASTPFRSISFWVAAVWLTGSLLLALRYLFTINLMRTLENTRTGSRPPKVDQELIQEIATATGMERPVQVVINAFAFPAMPMTWGFRRPIILLPKRAASWTQDELRPVLLHELGHVRRRDCLAQAVALAACCLYWFNPLVWIAAECMRAEAETAADSFVLNADVKPSDYALQLLRHVSEVAQKAPFLGSVGVPLVRSSRIERRLRAILDPGRTRRGLTSWEMLVTIIPLALLASLLGMARPVVPPKAAAGKSPQAPKQSHKGESAGSGTLFFVLSPDEGKGWTAASIPSAYINPFMRLDGPIKPTFLRWGNGYSYMFLPGAASSTGSSNKYFPRQNTVPRPPDG